METYYSVRVKVGGQRNFVRIATADLKGMRVGDTCRLSDGRIGVIRKITAGEGFSLNPQRAATPGQHETQDAEGTE